MCERCQEPETVEHGLMGCRKYVVERRDMMEGRRRAGLTGDGITVTDVLNGGGMDKEIS